MDDKRRAVNEGVPAAEGDSPPEDEELRRRKHLEVTCRALAGSVVAQLVESGCDAGQLIDFASEVLRSVTERGVKPNGEPPGCSPSGSARITPIRCRCEPAGDGKHRIHGKRVSLRPLTADDGALLSTWAAEGQIRTTCSEALLHHLTGDLPAAVADPARRDLVIRNEDGRDIGLVDLFAIDPEVGQAEMAKLLGDPAMRGRGYAKEATHLLLAYAFGELGLGRVYLRTAGFNLHNIRLNEKVGFRFEGILRRAHVLCGRLIDVALMSVLREDYLRAFRIENEP